MGVSINTALPLNGAISLNFDVSGVALLGGGQKAGYIMVLDTVKRDVDEIPLTLSDLERLDENGDRVNTGVYYTVRNLTNGTLYAFTLVVYNGNNETLVLSSPPKTATPATVPGEVKFVSCVSDNANTSNSGTVALKANLLVGASNGHAIDFIKVYVVDTSDYSAAPVVKVFRSKGYTLANSSELADKIVPGPLSLSLSDASIVANKQYIAYAEAINAAGAGPSSNVVDVNTSNAPSALKVTSVVSGQDAKLTVSVETVSPQPFALTKVTLQYWEVNSLALVTEPPDATTIFTKEYSADAFGNLQMNDLVLTADTAGNNSIANNKAYAVAAYATSAYGMGPKAVQGSVGSLALKGPFATGVAAKLPKAIDFSSGFVLGGAVNSAAAGAAPNGELGLTNAAAIGTYTYPLSASVKYFDQNKTLLSTQTITSGSTSIVINSNRVFKQTAADIIQGVKYSASVSATTAIPTSVSQYWVTPALSGSLSVTADLDPVSFSVAPLSAPIYRSYTSYTDQSGNNGLELFWSAPLNNGGSSVTGYKVELYDNTATKLAEIATTLPYVFISGAATATIKASVNAASITDITNWSALLDSKTYYAKISATNSVGYGTSILTTPTLYISSSPRPVTSLSGSSLRSSSALGAPFLYNITWDAPSVTTDVTGYNVISYDSELNKLASVFTDVNQSRSYKFTLPASTTKISYGVQTVKVANGVTSTSNVVINQDPIAQVPTISFSRFETGTGGNAVMYFSVNNGGAALNGVTVFVVPDPSTTSITLDQGSDLVIASDGAAASSNGYLLAPSGSGNVKEFQVNLPYKVPSSKQSYLIVASNAQGANYLSSNLV